MSKILKNFLVFIICNKYLFIIFLLGLLLRLYGINHGLPLTFNMDENSFVRSVTALRFSLNPNRFDWPHANMYLMFVFYMGYYYFRALLQFLNFRVYFENLFPLLWQDPAIYYFVSRIITAFLGALTVFPLYYAANVLLKNKTFSLLSSLIFSILPFAVFDSHYAILDTALTFWICFFLYFVFKLTVDSSKLNFFFSGIFLGLAFGTKYNAIFYSIVYLICFLYLVFPIKSLKDAISKITKKSIYHGLFLSLIGFLIAFVITNPTVITNFKMFWSYEYGRGFLFQFKNVSSLEPVEYPKAFYDIFFSQNPNDLGIILYFFILLGSFLYLFFNYRNKITNLTILFPILIYLYMCTKSRHPSHYFLFLYPLLSIFASKLFLDFYNFLNIHFFKYKKYIFTLFLIIVLSTSLLQSLKYSYIFSQKDNRLLMYEYIDEQIPDGSTLYIYGSDLSEMKFSKISESQIKRFDISNVDISKLPFYILIGDKYVTKSELTTGEMDTPYIKGNESRFLTNSEYIVSYENPYNLGPKMYLFKTYYVGKKR